MMDKQDIIKAYERLTSAINKLNSDLKINTLDIGKAYSILINLVHDLNTCLTLKQEEKKTIDKEISELNTALIAKRSELQALITKGNNEINKQRENFESIKESETKRMSLLNSRAEEKLEQAGKVLSDAKQKDAEINEKIENFKKDIFKFNQFQEEYRIKNEDLTKREDTLKLQSISLQSQYTQAKNDLENIAKTKEYITEKEASVKQTLEETRVQNKILETNLNNSIRGKNDLLILKRQLDDKEITLKDLEKHLTDWKKQLDDKDKNLAAYKEEIDYKMALERQGLEKQKRELVLSK